MNILLASSSRRKRNSALRHGVIKTKKTTDSLTGVRCSSEVVCLLLVQWFVGSISDGGHIELFLVPASAPQME